MNQLCTGTNPCTVFDVARGYNNPGQEAERIFSCENDVGVGLLNGPTIDTAALMIGAAGASYCGDLSSYIRRKFQITASALKSDPSWNFTPSRTANIQRSDRFHPDARR
jgi:hypothetical protein